MNDVWRKNPVGSCALITQLHCRNTENTIQWSDFMTHTEFTAALSIFSLPEKIALKINELSTKMEDTRRDSFFNTLQPLIDDFEHAQKDLSLAIDAGFSTLRRIKCIELPKMHKAEEQKEHEDAEKLLAN